MQQDNSEQVILDPKLIAKAGLHKTVHKSEFTDVKSYFSTETVVSAQRMIFIGYP